MPQVETGVSRPVRSDRPDFRPPIGAVERTENHGAVARPDAGFGFDAGDIWRDRNDAQLGLRATTASGNNNC